MGMPSPGDWGWTNKKKLETFGDHIAISKLFIKSVDSLWLQERLQRQMLL